MKLPSGVDLVAGPHAALHAEDARHELDQVVARGAHDEGRAALVAMRIDLVEHLRIDARQDLGQNLRPEALELAG